MARYERRQSGGKLRDTVRLPTEAEACQCHESLQATGFTPCGETPDEGADDMDGNISPPPGGPLPGDGAQRRRRGLAPYELWSSDEETGIGAGFGCVHDACKGIFYAKLWAPLGGDRDEGSPSGVGAERSTKGAITTLFDVVEACRCRKITVGLCAEDAASAELVCSLLYLGFQVVPACKSPLEGTALLLDFDIGFPAWQGPPVSSDYTCTDAFDCSTSADESCSRSPGSRTDSS